MTCELRARGIACSENRVARIMRSRACELVPGVPFARRLPSPITRPILRPICYPKGLLQLTVLSSLRHHLHSYQGRLALSGYRHRSVLPRHLGWNFPTLCTPIWSSMPPHAPSTQASCPGEQSFTPPPSPASCSSDIAWSASPSFPHRARSRST